MYPPLSPGSEREYSLDLDVRQNVRCSEQEGPSATYCLPLVIVLSSVVTECGRVINQRLDQRREFDACVILVLGVFPGK